jgi:cytochrome P450 family 4
VIKSRKKYLSENHDETAENEDDVGMKKRVAFLDLLLQVTVDGKPLDDESIREEVDTFMFEGHDTTSSGIAFCLLNLAKYPEIQQKVYEECKEVLGDDPRAPASMKDLNNLEKVIKEVLRLYPSVPFFARRLNSEFTSNGYTFPEGITVTIAPYFAGRDPKLFPNPLKFDPSRFDGDEKIPLYSYVPFSAGPRKAT